MSNYYQNNSHGALSFHWKRVSDQFEYVTVGEVKDHLNIYDTLDRKYLTQIMLTACQLAESFVGDYFNPTTIELYTPVFCDVALSHQGANSITSITYLDEDNTSQTLDPTQYYLDLTSRQPTVRFEAGFSSPSLSSRIKPVTITYVTKLGDITRDVDNRVNDWGGNDVKLAVLMYCNEIFYNRDNITEGSVNKLPLCSERLLAKYRRVVV
jgi:uncharacterized phiE125 gp8 family phage protein